MSDGNNPSAVHDCSVIFLEAGGLSSGEVATWIDGEKTHTLPNSVNIVFFTLKGRRKKNQVSWGPSVHFIPLKARGSDPASKIFRICIGWFRFFLFIALVSTEHFNFPKEMILKYSISMAVCNSKRDILYDQKKGKNLR